MSDLELETRNDRKHDRNHQPEASLVIDCSDHATERDNATKTKTLAALKIDTKGITLGILTPPSGTTGVPPNAPLAVTVRTDDASLLHELLLIQCNPPVQKAQVTFTPAFSANAASVPIPAGDLIKYFLELGLAPSASPTEQFRHRIVITTGQAGAPLVVGLSQAPVGPPAPPNTPITIEFTATPTGGSGTYALFTLHPGDGGPDQYSVSPVIRHTYAPGGAYSATVTVQDSAGATANSLAVNIAVAGLALASTLSGLPTPDNYAGGPKSVTFTANPSGGSGVYTRYQFDAGDGANTSDQTSPIWTVTLPVGGPYQPSVTVTDSLGNTFTARTFGTYTISV